MEMHHCVGAGAAALQKTCYFAEGASALSLLGSARLLWSWGAPNSMGLAEVTHCPS